MRVLVVVFCCVVLYELINYPKQMLGKGSNCEADFTSFVNKYFRTMYLKFVDRLSTHCFETAPLHLKFKKVSIFIMFFYLCALQEKLDIHG